MSENLKDQLEQKENNLKGIFIGIDANNKIGFRLQGMSFGDALVLVGQWIKDMKKQVFGD